MKTRKVRKGAIDLMVKVIDWSPINEIISEAVGVEVECRLGNALIEDVEAIFDKEYEIVETKSLIIDKECCGRSTDTNSFHISQLNEGKPFSVVLMPNVEFYKVHKEIDNKRSIAMFPSYEFNIDIDDVKKCLTGEEITLYEFMNGRYRYNPRIEANEMDILNLVYYNQIIEGNTEFANEEEMELMN
jgi:hypothetical protein